MSLKLNEVIVLKSGYSTRTDAGEQKADCTITLIKGPSTNILFDTGLPFDQDHIIKGLGSEGLTVGDISIIVCSHGHSDHVGNLGLFAHSLLIVGYDICRSDVYFDNLLSEGQPYDVDIGIKVIPTPGHTTCDVSVIVNNTKHGTVLVAGDLFECELDITDSSLWKSVSNDVQLQATNRYNAVQNIDCVVPGHGPMFFIMQHHKHLLLSQCQQLNAV